MAEIGLGLAGEGRRASLATVSTIVRNETEAPRLMPQVLGLVLGRELADQALAKLPDRLPGRGFGHALELGDLPVGVAADALDEDLPNTLVAVVEGDLDALDLLAQAKHAAHVERVVPVEVRLVGVVLGLTHAGELAAHGVVGAAVDPVGDLIERGRLAVLKLREELGHRRLHDRLDPIGVIEELARPRLGGLEVQACGLVISREELAVVERHGGDDSSDRSRVWSFDHERFLATFEFANEWGPGQRSSVGVGCGQFRIRDMSRTQRSLLGASMTR